MIRRNPRLVAWSNPLSLLDRLQPSHPANDTANLPHRMSPQ